MAAALLGAPARFCWPEGEPAPGRAAVTLELPYGTVALAFPLSGRALRPNRALAGRPDLMTVDPYGEGWLLEVEGPALAPATQLVAGPVAREHAVLDLRHFRRRAALDLLTDTAPLGATMADGGQALTDLRRMLGPRRYLALVREIVR